MIIVKRRIILAVNGTYISEAENADDIFRTVLKILIT